MIVTGKTRAEHKNNLEAVFVKIKDAGLKVKLEKCDFFQSEINYLGHTISKHGLKKNDDKVKAIVNAPRPQTVTQVKSFAGLVNYYSKFVPKLSLIMHPIYALLKKGNKFCWDEECETAFAEIKRVISSDQILVHFDPKLPIIVSTDASQEGIAAAMSHKMIDGTIRPIAFISRTLTQPEISYSVLDKEALAIFWAVRKFYYYLMGQNHFVIKCDHKPLLSIFGHNKGLPQMAAARLQRWALFLSGFNFTIEYIKGSDNKVADMLSRHAVKENNKESNVNEDCNYLNLIITQGIPIDAKKIAIETRKEPILSKVYDYLKNGWPEEPNEQIKPYFNRKDQLTLEQNCILWGYRVIIPIKYRQQLLDELHSSHLGIVKMKSTARSYFWWPKLDGQIEDIGKNCLACLKVSADPSKSVVVPWNTPQKPWQRLHIDFLGPLKKFF